MKSLTILFAVAMLGLSLLPLARGTAQYGKKEGKKCDYCHVKAGSKELNDTGKCYKEKNHSLEGCPAPAAPEKE
jgi:hypothetical protein